MLNKEKGGYAGRWVAKQGGVAMQGNGWLRREMGVHAWRCVAMQGDGWLSREMCGKGGRWMAKE